VSMEQEKLLLSRCCLGKLHLLQAIVILGE